MATVKSDVEAVAACDWNDVDHLIQTLNVFSVYHFRKTDNITITIFLVSCNIHSHKKTLDTASASYVILHYQLTYLLT